MTTDMSEAGLEELILRAMTGRTDTLSPAHKAIETAVPVAGGTGWLLGDAEHYDRDYAVDLVQLRGFLMATQESLVEVLSLDTDGPTRRKFLARLQGEITKRGVIDVLRGGIKHGAHDVDLFYGTPTPGNAKAEERFARNRFSVSRQHPEEDVNKKVELRGRILFADGQNRKSEIKIVGRAGTHTVRVPAGMMTDIVRPLWDVDVVATCSRRKRRLVLEDVHAETE